MCLVELGLEALEGGPSLVALLLKAGELVLTIRVLGDRSLQALQFCGGLVVLTPKPSQLLLTVDLRLGERAFQRRSVGPQPLLRGDGRTLRFRFPPR